MKMQKIVASLMVIVVTIIAYSKTEKTAKILRAACTVHDPTTIKDVNCWAKPINRSVSVINMRGNFTQMVHQININVQLYKRSEPRFKPFLVNVTEDFCKFLVNKKGANYLALMRKLYLPYTNINHTCPYFGYVFIKDLHLDSNNIPLLWPPAEYRVDVLLIGDHRKIITMQYFLEIKENNKRWKRKVSVENIIIPKEMKNFLVKNK